MGKVKEALLEDMYKGLLKENFTVGEKVIPYSHRRCHYCNTWFRFRYDAACKEIASNGFYKLVCPECEREYVYEREMHLPDENIRFVEVE